MDTKQLRVSEIADLGFVRGEKRANGNRPIRFFPAARPSRACRKTVASLQREARIAVLKAVVVHPDAADPVEPRTFLILSLMAGVAIVVGIVEVGTFSRGTEDFVRFVQGLL